MANDNIVNGSGSNVAVLPGAAVKDGEIESVLRQVETHLKELETDKKLEVTAFKLFSAVNDTLRRDPKFSDEIIKGAGLKIAEFGKRNTAAKKTMDSLVKEIRAESYHNYSNVGGLIESEYNQAMGPKKREEALISVGEKYNLKLEAVNPLDVPALSEYAGGQVAVKVTWGPGPWADTPVGKNGFFLASDEEVDDPQKLEQKLLAYAQDQQVELSSAEQKFSDEIYAVSIRPLRP